MHKYDITQTNSHYYMLVVHSRINVMMSFHIRILKART